MTTATRVRSRKAKAKSAKAKPAPTLSPTPAVKLKPGLKARLKPEIDALLKPARKAPAKRARVLSPVAARLKRIEVVANPASGSVGPTAAEEVKAILAAYGLKARIQAPEPSGLMEALDEAVRAKPDLIVILAGDGTARAAASICGASGPLIAPLPGGTMNMLPHALYGVKSWQEALDDALSGGVERPVSGGEVDGKPFYVAAILGGPAMFTYAREEVRAGHLDRAIRRARVALRRVFRSPLRFVLNDEPPEKASALTLMCPLVSRAMDEHERALEAVCLNYRNAADGFRLGLRTVVSQFIGDWRNDPSVSIRRIRKGQAWAGRNIPGVLDGEPFSLPRKVEIRFKPLAFRALALAETPGAAAPVKG